MSLASVAIRGVNSDRFAADSACPLQDGGRSANKGLTDEPLLMARLRLFLSAISAIPLPIIRIERGTLGLHGNNEVMATGETDPEGFSPGKTIALAVEKAAETGHHPHHLVQ